MFIRTILSYRSLLVYDRINIYFNNNNININNVVSWTRGLRDVGQIMNKRLRNICVVGLRQKTRG